MAQYLFRTSLLIAVLQQCDSASGQFVSKLKQRLGWVLLLRKACSIHNGIEFGQTQSVPAHAPFLSARDGPRAKKRSINFVSNLPFWKSGSARMRRCSGIVV